MVDLKKIKEELLGLVGWRQNIDVDGVQLIPIVEGVVPDEVTIDLSLSESGKWYDGVHPLLTLDNLYSASPDFENLHSEVVDEVARKALIDGAFTQWLREKMEDSIDSLLEDWSEDKEGLKTYNDLLASGKLFLGSGKLSDVEENDGKIVGFEIVPSPSSSMRISVKKIGFHFEGNENFTLYLYRSDSKIPIASQSIVYTGNGSVEWFDVSEFDSDLWWMRGEGVYYVAYDQSALSSRAINGVRNYHYGSRGKISFPSGRHFMVKAFDVDGSIGMLWDVDENGYSVDSNYGINMEYEVSCDFTDFIVAQKSLFGKALRYRVGMDLLKLLQFNPETRVNRHVVNAKRNEVNYEIEGDTQGKSDFSVVGKYKKALKSLRFDMGGVDKICLPCLRSGVRYRPVGPNVR